ncbi:MAG: hypothetical protein ACTSRS_13125 [Candidatus Helarchaeota archaeon]
MGVKLKSLVISQQVALTELAGKTIVVDGCNYLFKFISTIRARGRILYNREQEPISHLIGLFYFCINLLEWKLRPIFVFDGFPPKEKRARSPEKIRKLVKMWGLYHQNASTACKAVLFQDPQFLYDKLITDMQEVIRLMGFPVICCISEGEAQGARLVREGKAYALLSSDYDCLLFGSPRTIHKLSLQQGTCTLLPLSTILSKHHITRQQLIDIALCIGTDYNAGLHGIGPKLGLKLIKQYGQLENIPDIELPFDPAHLRSLFLHPATRSIKPIFRAPNSRQLAYHLETKGLQKRRVRKGIHRLQRAYAQLKLKQATLSSFY